MEKFLEMKFLKPSGSTLTLKVPFIKDDATESQAKTLMDYIVSNNLFLVKGEEVSAKKSAQFITINKAELSI